MQKIASHSRLKPELSGVLLRSDRMVSTDSFRLLEVRKPITLDEKDQAGVIVRTKSFTGAGDISLAGNIITETVGEKSKQTIVERVADADLYPKYETIMPDVSKEYHAIDVNAEMLGELLTEVSKHADRYHRVTIHIPETKYKPVVITTDNVTALQMPLQK